MTKELKRLLEYAEGGATLAWMFLFFPLAILLVGFNAKDELGLLCFSVWAVSGRLVVRLSRAFMRRVYTREESEANTALPQVTILSCSECGSADPDIRVRPADDPARAPCCGPFHRHETA